MTHTTLEPRPAPRALPITLPLSRGEASALLRLADLARAVLDADRRAMHPAQRDDARRALSRLRTLSKSGT